eukprot:CAMPEP_0118964984 /NCGR_PEP_ID=MMETSP1173-20130426/2578_1 /TAXON_ID=1034831 /ORGANISM="Rhizochromulina marina cf, Strain CCMP1243" /LENGTH=336 /DNA_ID=CAMNT_0006913517 /DNA_START=82 /DNA_END=1089 /DNA_ORIENTATION=-
MFSSAGAVHGGPPQARLLEALKCEGEGHRFVSATSNPQEDSNEIQVLHFDEEASSLRHVASYTHPEAATAICPAGVDSDHLLTASPTGVALWKLQEDLPEVVSEHPDPGSVKELGQLAKASIGHVTSLATQPTQQEPKIAAGREQGVSLFTLGSLTPTENLEIPGDPRPHVDRQVRRCTWDPHTPRVLCCAYDTAAILWDSRDSARPTQSFTAHKYGATDIDFNPNRPMVIMSAGEDRLVKFWDLRHTQAPIRVLAGHTHWVTTARYNRFHDQLVLSAGTDGAVNLWRVSSISSSPILDYDGEPGMKTETMDSKVNTYDDHEEAVYSAAWSASDAW